MLQAKSVVSGDHPKGKKLWIYIPQHMSSDSQFKFGIRDTLEGRFDPEQNTFKAKKVNVDKHRLDNYCTIQGVERKLWLYIAQKLVQRREFPFKYEDQIMVSVSPEEDTIVIQPISLEQTAIVNRV